VLRALPIASNIVLSVPNVDPGAGLNADPVGVPELTAGQAITGSLEPGTRARRFAVPGAELGDILFRLDANTLSGTKGDGSRPVPKGTMCLFRPLTGAPTLADAYLIRRTDGKAFGATGAEWTVGRLQAVSNGVRVRYRADSKHMECASELVMPADVVEPIALFVKAVR
jgi:hypothetical protein